MNGTEKSDIETMEIHLRKQRSTNNLIGDLEAIFL